ncbi:alpha-L-rhamnosidase C-terminal domain-containing protein [Streptomyces sp. NPDC087270]|uniref:alpha-L-rhamnosidase C-terminal domain-containing protein n=1 Tax=Streptomyces sp. NPDC087270 TaxID=3365774 RepID=UPI0038118949
MPDPAHPGYARFCIRPQPGGGPTHAEATPRSPHGTIGSSWRDAGKGLVMQVTVPRGSTATIYVPATSAHQVTASAGPVPPSGPTATPLARWQQATTPSGSAAER